MLTECLFDVYGLPALDVDDMTARVDHQMKKEQIVPPCFSVYVTYIVFQSVLGIIKWDDGILDDSGTASIRCLNHMSRTS